MFDIEHETDPARLRQYARLMERQNGRMRKLLDEMARELVEARREEPEQLALRLQEIEHQLAVRNRYLFGPRSERRSTSKTATIEPPPTPGAEPSLADEGEKAPRKGHGPRPQPKLFTVEIEHELAEDDRACNACDGHLDPMGDIWEESEEIDYIPAEYVIVRHRRRKYRCRCNGNVTTAPGPVKLQPGGRYSPGFAVAVALDKYQDHLPLERQVRRLKQLGLEIDSQTLWDQLDVLAKALQPTYEAIGAAILQAPVLHADETSWKLLGTKYTKGKKHWAWAVASQSLVFYRILDSRSQEAGAQVLAGYRGIVMTDDYAVYEALASDKQLPLAGSSERGSFQLVHCWAHARRKFHDAAPAFPAETDEILELIGKLYAVERKVAALPEEERLAKLAVLRNTESRAIIEAIETFRKETRALPQSALGKAIAYMTGIWTGLTAFLGNPRIPLDNNLAERELRNVVVERSLCFSSARARKQGHLGFVRGPTRAAA